MPVPEGLLRNLGDTARWVASMRARETARPDALFRDPLAARLAGDAGAALAAALSPGRKNDWPFTIRTLLFDECLKRELAAGADLVINLAAGLDARPYRMALPPSLLWVEIDMPALIAAKAEALRDERPACSLERVGLDLADTAARRELLTALAARGRRAVIMTEGLIIYLTREQVGSLGEDLAAHTSFHTWITDLASPGLLPRLQKTIGQHLANAGMPLRFAPEEGTAFFRPHGWGRVSMHSLFKEAGRRGRLPWMFRPFSWLPDPPDPAGRRPWGGVIVLHRAGRG